MYSVPPGSKCGMAADECHNDSWIAATAIARDLPIVTQDDDYDGIPGLEVIRV